MEDIVTMLETHKPQLFGISEANIHPNAHTPSMNIPGYSLETDRLPLDKFRGQVAIYVTKDIKYKRRLDLEPPLMPMIWLEVEVQKEKNILINIGYREWTQQTSVKTKARGKKKRNNEERSDSLDSKKVGKTMMKQKERLNTMIASWEKASLEEKPLFIMGDWNINTLPWSNINYEPTQYDKDMKTLLEILQQAASTNNLELSTKLPSRKQGQDNQSSLDIILSNIPQRIQNIIYRDDP